MIEKLDMQTPDFTDKNITKIAALFPNCVTETKDQKGNITKAIDFDLLKQELSGNIVEGTKERYALNWPGKKEALVTANKPINKTFRPDVEDSVDFDTTQNLYIEGDNLEALKLLQESYLNKIKMIYIDPPYNTGKDFVYKDNFTGDRDEELEASGQISEEGRLVANLESNGRYHSDWLSMMYPRLKLARNLLKEDGVLFISIDDNEVHNLRKMCDEVFGEDNFIAKIIWKKRASPPNDKVIASTHEYILMFAKNINSVQLYRQSRSKEQLARYKNPDNHKKGRWIADNLMANVKGGRFSKALYFPITNPLTKEEHYPSSNGNWRYSRETIEKLLNEDAIYFGTDGKGRPKLKRFLCDVKDGVPFSTNWDNVGYNNSATKEVANIFGTISYFETPKPTTLLSNILKLSTNENDIILDFFAGSSTTADATMKLNSEDGVNRKFIMVQLPEETDEKSEAYKSGYKNICEIGKERIRRAGKKIVEESRKTDLDIGFRVLKIDSSNMNDVYYSPDEVKQEFLFETTVDHIKADRDALDLLFQVLLDSGVDLTLPIEKKEILGKEVYFVDDNALVACFEERIDEALVTEIAKMDDMLKVVFKDSSFPSDDVRINTEQIFKEYAPDTDVRVI